MPIGNLEILRNLVPVNLVGICQVSQSLVFCLHETLTDFKSSCFIMEKRNLGVVPSVSSTFVRWTMVNISGRSRTDHFHPSRLDQF